ncbi:hypothetical protein RSJ22_00440 (plasmid) [Clostridium botulinum]|uniref:hypothetical protein n=1 Tax=Clostridium botulinum TaxID=1491 RepID=UPI000C7568B1|nr:hypothetical protein [Clostridium botulinum]AUN19998.1 hypothetical protein RSJ22_00440 [Clostridium botulinum]MCR1167307.1 hypothetical protein [Clostridium botulinum]
MCNKKRENWFKCKKCFREMAIEKSLFNDVYKGQTLCVKCRIKEENRNATKAEAMALLGEESIDTVTRESRANSNNIITLDLDNV